MKSAGVGAVQALAEWRDVAKTCWRKRVLWQSGDERRELAAVAAMGPAGWRGMTGSGTRCVAARAPWSWWVSRCDRVRGTWFPGHASQPRI